MNATCPTCSQPIASLTLLVCLESNTATRFGQSVRLTPQTAVMLHAMLARFPRAASFSYLALQIWGHGNGPDAELETIRVHISRVRRLLEPLHVRIECRNHVGYRLVLDALPAVREVA